MIIALTGSHHPFSLKAFIKTFESVIATQGDFGSYFMRHPNDAVPNRKSILLWVENSVQNSTTVYTSTNNDHD